MELASKGESVGLLERLGGGQGPPSTKFRIVVSSLIALTSLLGALAAWRAESAASRGDEAERKGFADNVANEQTKADIRARQRYELFDYERAQSYFAQAKALARQARGSGPDASRLLAQAATLRKLGKLVLGYVDPDALRPDRTLDLDRYFAVNYEHRRSGEDLDSSAEFHEADALAKRSERDVGLTALLIAGAFFFTLGNVSRRRSARLLYVGGGLIVLVTGSVLLLLVEVIA